MPPDLPESYYLDNVLTLFEHVERVYADILEPELLEFLQTFAALDDDAKRLCIRLLNRSGDWFRAGKLNYPEISSLDAAIEQLDHHRLFAVDAEIDAETLLRLYTKPELLALHPNAGELARLRREELELALLEQNDDAYFETLLQQDRLLQLLCSEPYAQCQMLFFGNLNQSMTDFVLRDLGLYQYETYQIDQAHRPYRNSIDIQHHWLLHQLETLFQLSDLSSAEPVAEILALLPEDIDQASPTYRKSERLRFEIARQLERLEQLDTALELYRSCPLTPSRERSARILDRQGLHQEAFEACLEILETPLDDEEIQFACMFATRLAKRHDFELPPAVERQRIDHKPEIVELELDYHDSVEIAVAEHYAELDPDGHCYYLENSLFNGVLGLLLWEVVFAPLPGVFYNAFQYRPSDFYTPEFCRNRESQLEALWRDIDSNDDIGRILRARWRDKQGLMNPLVNWLDLDLELIELALERIEYRHWRAVFARILADLRNNRAGFPDLVYFPSAGGYELIEVKGPGDTLQKNQQRWMQHFSEHGIPHRLARVTWRQS